MPNSSESVPLLIAHRGNAAEFPENTLPALRSALELGAKHIEFDVHLTADHVPVVVHDANLKRTGDLDLSVFEKTWEELAGIAVGETARFGARYADVGIPNLNQVLQLLIRFPDATAFVELKRASLRQFGQEVVVHRVCDSLKPFASQIVIISFDLPAITYVRQQTAHRIGWVLSEYSTLSAIKAEAIAPDFLFCDWQLLPAGGAKLWRGPWRWAIYEVTTGRLAAELAARGASFVEGMEVRTMLRELRHLQQA